MSLRQPQFKNDETALTGSTGNEPDYMTLATSCFVATSHTAKSSVFRGDVICCIKCSDLSLGYDDDMKIVQVKIIT